jgi:rhamnogalacturonan endolyase
LAVHTATVSVRAGAVTKLHSIAVTADPSAAAVVWRIGDWDGTPQGFKNAALMTHAHPSDVRASTWTGDFTIGQDASAFPAYLWKDVNDGIQIRFKLTGAQAATAHSLRIGITTAFANGRPQVTVNAWKSGIPAPVPEPDTRSLTVGSYRGNNHTYEFEIPASALKTGADNVLKINIVSGTSGSGFLNPGVAIDCVELGARLSA